MNHDRITSFRYVEVGEQRALRRYRALLDMVEGLPADAYDPEPVEDAAEQVVQYRRPTSIQQVRTYEDCRLRKYGLLFLIESQEQVITTYDSGLSEDCIYRH